MSMRFSRIPVLAIGLFAVLLLGACTKTTSDVAAFSSLPDDSRGARYYFEPSDSQEGSQEFATYAGYVEKQLAKAGWERAPDDGSRADYAVTMGYDISRGVGIGSYYERYFNLRIADSISGVPVYEVKATSVGTAAEFGPIAPCMIRAAFKKFPAADSDQYIVARSDCDR